MSGFGGDWGETPWGDQNTVEQLAALMPRGIAWNLSDGSNLYNLLSGLAAELDRAKLRILNAVEESDPRTCNELLEQWEDVLGLPDPCDPGASFTETQRRTIVHSKFIGTGGQTFAFYNEIAEALGYTDVTFTRPPRFTCNSECDDTLYADYWWHTIIVEGTPSVFDDVLECRLDHYKQAHTFFDYRLT